jgi:hypothetical protein
MSEPDDSGQANAKGRAVAQAVYSLASQRGGPGSCPGSMWGLWWTKRHWGRFSPSTSVSPANQYSPTSPSSSPEAGTIGLFGGISGEWTQLDSTPPLYPIVFKN